MPILQSEVEEALKAMRPGKTVGEDGIAAEMLEVLVEWGVEVVTKIANCIYDTVLSQSSFKQLCKATVKSTNEKMRSLWVFILNGLIF